MTIKNNLMICHAMTFNSTDIIGISLAYPFSLSLQNVKLFVDKDRAEVVLRCQHFEDIPERPGGTFRDSVVDDSVTG